MNIHEGDHPGEHDTRYLSAGELNVRRTKGGEVPAGSVVHFPLLPLGRSALHGDREEEFRSNSLDAVSEHNVTTSDIQTMWDEATLREHPDAILIPPSELER